MRCTRTSWHSKSGQETNASKYPSNITAHVWLKCKAQQIGQVKAIDTILWINKQCGWSCGCAVVVAQILLTWTWCCWFLSVTHRSVQDSGMDREHKNSYSWAPHKCSVLRIWKHLHKLIDCCFLVQGIVGPFVHLFMLLEPLLYAILKGGFKGSIEAPFLSDP